MPAPFIKRVTKFISRRGSVPIIYYILTHSQTIFSLSFSISSQIPRSSQSKPNSLTLKPLKRLKMLGNNVLPIPPPPKVSPNLLTLLILSSLFCDYATLTSIIPVIPPLLEPLTPPLPSASIFILFSIKPFFQIISNKTLGRIADSNNGGNVIAVLQFCNIILFLATVCFAIGVDPDYSLSPFPFIESSWISYFTNPWPQYILLFVSRSVQGVASAGIMTAGMSAIAKLADDEVRGQKMVSFYPTIFRLFFLRPGVTDILF